MSKTIIDQEYNRVLFDGSGIYRVQLRKPGTTKLFGWMDGADTFDYTGTWSIVPFDEQTRVGVMEHIKGIADYATVEILVEEKSRIVIRITA